MEFDRQPNFSELFALEMSLYCDFGSSGGIVSFGHRTSFSLKLEKKM